MHNTRSRNSGFSESADGLLYAEHMSVAMRLFVGFIGVSMFVVPVPFVIHAHAGLPWYHLLLVAVCVVLSSLLGVFLLTVALCRPLHLQFDKRQRQLLLTSRWPLGKRCVPVPYESITGLDLLQRESEDGPYYVVRLALNGKRPFHLGSFDSREDAEHWLARLEAQRAPPMRRRNV